MLENKVILGDAYKIIKSIPDNSVDLIITDPPYIIGKHNNQSNGLGKHLDNLCDELDNAGLSNGYDLGILDDFLRIMKKINIYIWCNKAQIPYYLNYFVTERKCSYDILVWIKTNPVPLYGRNYLNDKEYCLYFRKGYAMHTTYDSAKTYWITPTNVKDKQKYGHPTIKPLPIIETLVKNSSDPGDTVADFFLGSGTTSVAAIKNERNFIGTEKEEKNYKICLERSKLLN